jgi:hypothetical protein
MWIRDTLPKLLPSVRFILYGYDTTLVDSRSFQNIPDLALTLINEMKAGGWTSSAAKPTVFLAHSLGGVVLKQTFVLLADSSEIDKAILGRIKGAIFFGVPSQGMDIGDIFGMLGSQPNKDALVKFISTESPYLTQLERQVFGISYVRHMKLLWAYETQTTPTIVVSFIVCRNFYSFGFLKSEKNIIGEQRTTSEIRTWDSSSFQGVCNRRPLFFRPSFDYTNRL